jgi:FAD/FMN-containing dehydrogenase
MSEIRGVDDMSRPLEAKDIRGLAGTLSGSVVEPVDPGYDDSRRIWNGMIDRRPALIARCVDAADVVTAVNFARATGVVMSVRGGDHSAAGNAVCEGGMMIDLSHEGAEGRSRGPHRPRRTPACGGRSSTPPPNGKG